MLLSKIVSDNSVEKTNNFISTPNNQNKYLNQQVDFVFAAEKSIETVVHIKSKFLIDNIYRYYDPLEDFSLEMDINTTSLRKDHQVVQVL